MATRQPGGSRFRSDSNQAPTRRPAAQGGARFQGARPARSGVPTTHGAHRAQGRPTAATGRVQPAYTRRSTLQKSSPVPIIIAGVAILAVVAAVVAFAVPAIQGLFSALSEPEIEAGVEVQVTIPEGASGDAIAQALSEAGVIPDPKDYYAAVRAIGADTQIKPGDYLFTTLQDPDEVVAQLVEGPNVQGVSLTVAEGLTVSQTAQRVEEVYGIPADDFLAQAKASAYVGDYPFLEGAADDSLEGFLFPKTYSFSGDPTADDVIRAMLDQYQIEVASLDFDAARTLVSERYGVDMTDYEFLTLASIIEREALNDDQRLNVASTFYNRMSDGMALQSDATMMYVTGGEVTADDLDTESPYNTYHNTGLTPTPICSPSLASIKAALEPADTDYLYFFITRDNEYFSETYDQHLQAIEENR